MTCVRFTVRRLMVGVALMALAIWCIERRGRFLNRVAFDTPRAFYVVHGTRGGLGPKQCPGYPRFSEAQIEWHGLMVAKYERAARYPWLPVPPDPPEPE